MKLLLAFSLLFLFEPAWALSFKQTSHHVNCEGGRFEYLLYAPDTEKIATEPLPAIMVLHGAGDHPDSFIEAWKSFARKENVVIIAPELPRKAEFEAVAPGVFRCMVKESATLTSLDLSRLYLFGHSMGGYLAYDGAMFDSDLFAAVAVHAMGIEPQYADIVKRAKRKTPIKIYIGDRDQFVALDGVRRTRDFLVREGFPVEYQEIKRHDHNYYALADEINADAWRFFSEHRLAEPSAEKH